jgi:hypothetical protein
LKRRSSESSIIQSAFELALGRSPTKGEITACITHWKNATETESEKTPLARAYPRKIKRTVMAEKTGEPYDFWEFIPAYESYQPDLQRCDADARTRGLAHVCLVLFNSNEFVYID